MNFSKHSPQKFLQQFLQEFLQQFHQAFGEEKFRNLSMKLYRKSSSNSSIKFSRNFSRIFSRKSPGDSLRIPPWFFPAKLLGFPEEFLQNIPQNSCANGSGIPPGIVYEFLQQFMLVLLQTFLQKFLLQSLQKIFRNSSKTFSQEFI